MSPTVVRVSAGAPRRATRDGYGEALVELGARDPRVVVFDADLSKSTKTALFARAYPERFFNAGIAEANMIGMAAGMAAGGRTVFASTFAIFAAQRALNQIFQSVAYTRLPVKIAVTHAGVTPGEDGATHQAIDDCAALRAIPGMTVLVPADAGQARAAVFAAAEHPGPVYLRLGRAPVPAIYDPGEPFPIGRAAVLRRGRDVTICAIGVMVGQALAAAELVAERGIEAEVIDVRSLKPLDADAIVASTRRTGAVVTAEEHNHLGGLGAAVAEVLGERAPVPLRRVGVADRFGQSGTPEALLAEYGLTAADVARAAEELLRAMSGGR